MTELMFILVIFDEIRPFFNINATHQLKIVKVPEKIARRNRLHFQLIHTQGGSKHLISKYFVFVRRRKIDFCWSIYPFIAIFQRFKRFLWTKNSFRVIFVADYYLELNSNGFRFLNFANRATRSRDTKNRHSFCHVSPHRQDLFCISVSSTPLCKI